MPNLGSSSRYLNRKDTDRKNYHPAWQIHRLHCKSRKNGAESQQQKVWSLAWSFSVLQRLRLTTLRGKCLTPSNDSEPSLWSTVSGTLLCCCTEASSVTKVLPGNSKPTFRKQNRSGDLYLRPPHIITSHHHTLCFNHFLSFLPLSPTVSPPWSCFFQYKSYLKIIHVFFPAGLYLFFYLFYFYPMHFAPSLFLREKWAEEWKSIVACFKGSFISSWKEEAGHFPKSI